MTDEGLRRQIAALAADSSNVVLIEHAKEQMLARQVTLAQVLEVLSKGAVVEPAHQHLRTNDWRCTLERRVAGDLVRVVCAVHHKATGEVVVVVTVMRARR
jgi:Domain of unknown function (DUF4258)